MKAESQLIQICGIVSKYCLTLSAEKIFGIHIMPQQKVEMLYTYLDS